MDEEFQYTNKFLRDNKDFILSLFYEFSWEKNEDWSEDKKKAAVFSHYVFSVLNAINIVCGLIDNCRDSRTDAEALLSSQMNTVEHHILGELADETDKLQLLPKVINFITPNVMDEYVKATMKIQAIKLGVLPNSFGISKIIKDNSFSLIEYESPYKYFVNFVFWMWVGNKEAQPIDLNALDKILLYKTKFDTASWFSRLENISTLDYSYEQYIEVLYGIVNDHTKVKDSECVKLFVFYLTLFEFMLSQFKKKDKVYIETDDRENFCGIIIPQEQTKEERRIEVAAAYLVEKHYIAEGDKDLFVRIMNKRSQPGKKIKFLNGGMNGEKDKGGKGVLYAIIRFIREENFDPNAKIEAKRQSIPDYSDDCWYFTFGKDTDDEKGEEKWKKIKDCGRKSRSLQKIIEDLNKN